MELNKVTLIAISGVDYQTKENIEAIKKSCEQINFGEVKYIQLGSIKDIDSWNEAVIYELPKYIDTEFCLFIHGDGFVIHPELWQDSWLDYDFIGAPWPLPNDSYSYLDDQGELVRVGNSVGLRSKRLMDLVAKRPKEWFWEQKI